jgi:hypothetical protein
MTIQYRTMTLDREILLLGGLISLLGAAERPVKRDRS